ncbi:hypothetical protein [Flavobacterium sp. PL12]|uniref:hypothetical protein n=1 Tax=Flavobacterium sp. PL12 TaxID=3071718 RepID=UPI00319E20A9
MELYIEKEFLDDFHGRYNENMLSASQKIVATILKEYAEVEWFIDCEIESIEKMETLKNENPFFHARSIYSSPIAIKSIKEHFFERSKCDQTLIFTQKDEDWFGEAERKGALCFSISNYKDKIENIVRICHFKIDLSEKFAGWENTMENIRKLIPLNKIIVNDSYLLDKPEFYENSVYPLIKAISKNKKTLKHFYTDFLNKVNFNKVDVYNFLQQKYSTSEIRIIQNNVDELKSHDRLLYSNHYIIDCAIGFNFNPRISSNSQIIIETIFEKYTYNRLRNHLRKTSQHFQCLVEEKKINAYYPN